MKNLVSKENTTITLASIGADEVASHIDATTTQAFNAKTKKDSSDKESVGDNTDLDYGGNERVSVLSDEEDEQMAKVTVVTPVMTEGDDARATQTLNPGEAIGDDMAETQEDKDGDNEEKKPKGPRDGSISHDPVRVHFLTFLNLIWQNELSKIFFPTTVTCLNGSVAQGGEFLSCEWMTDTSLQGTALRDMSWFMEF